MVLAYLRAYTSHASYAVTAPAFDPAMHRAVHALIRLAIIVMADFVA